MQKPAVGELTSASVSLVAVAALDAASDATCSTRQSNAGKAVVKGQDKTVSIRCCAGAGSGQGFQL